MPEEDLTPEEVEDLDAEKEGLALTGSKETTLVAFNSTSKTPKIKDDKIWEELRKKIMAEAIKMGFNPKLSEDKQTIRVLNAANKESMSVERNASNKTLTFSSKSPTTPEHLAGLLVDVKSCELKVAENSKVAAKLYQMLIDKGIKVTLSENVLQQLLKDPEHAHIAKKYLQKNPSETKQNASHAKPTGSKVVPPAADAVPPPATAAEEEQEKPKKRPGGP